MLGIPTNLLLEMSNVVLLIVGVPLLAYAIPYAINAIIRHRFPDWVRLLLGIIVLVIGLVIRSSFVGTWRVAGGRAFGDAAGVATAFGTAVAAAGLLWILATLTYPQRGHMPWVAAFVVALFYVVYSILLRM